MPAPMPTGGPRRGPRADAADDIAHAARAIAGVVLALRIGSFALAVVTQAGSAVHTDPVLRALALAVAAGETLTITIVIGLRWRRRRDVIARWVAPVSAVAAVLIVVLQLRSLPAGYRTATEAWSQQYTVISCVVIAVSSSRVRVAAAYIGCIALAYTLSTVPDAGIRHDRSQLAVAVDNVLAYPTFAVLALLAVGLYRSAAARAGQLREDAARSNAEQERFAVTSRGHRVAHDIGKAFLREVLAARLPADRLATWAANARGSLLDALVVDPRARVHVRAEIAQTCLPFLDAMPLTADLSGITQTRRDVPAVFIEAIREALNNASYHAPGAAVHLTGTITDGALVVSVADLGPGCDPVAVTTAWRTKDGTFERLRRAGGDYAVAHPSLGTVITLRYPLHSATRA